MHGALRLIVIAGAAFALQGCLAKTVVDTAVGVATLPVKVASAGVDTTFTLCPVFCDHACAASLHISSSCPTAAQERLIVAA